MPDHISFEVDYDEETHDEERFLVADVKVLVNGMLLTTLVFDTLEVLVHGTDGGLFYPLTCGCGAPGCAGIFDKVRLQCDEDLVTWSMPKASYGQHIHSSVPLEAGSYILRFERTQYEEALSNLLTELHRKRTDEGCPLALLPDSFPEECLTEQRLDNLDKYRVKFLESLRRERSRRELFGALADSGLIADFPNGRGYFVSAESACYLVMSDQGVTDEAARVVFISELAARSSTDGEGLVARVRRLQWADVENVAVLIRPGPDDAEGSVTHYQEIPDAEIQDLWTRAAVRLVADDNCVRQ